MIIGIVLLALSIVSILGMMLAVGSMDDADKFKVPHFDWNDDNHRQEDKGQEDKDVKRLQ